MKLPIEPNTGPMINNTKIKFDSTLDLNLKLRYSKPIPKIIIKTGAINTQNLSVSGYNSNPEAKKVKAIGISKIKDVSALFFLIVMQKPIINSNIGNKGILKIMFKP
ncbi:hypothetical protein GCM10022246_00830 [Pedobacter ginsengiterrae]|uniref:Cohesin domain-containing protein n=1 Tax=Pedobacter ginsengiterrae TaxID=871696 RepID=A0ABP7NM37_9SPHI